MLNYWHKSEWASPKIPTSTIKASMQNFLPKEYGYLKMHSNGQITKESFLDTPRTHG